MGNRAPLIASLLLVAGMAALSALAWREIPDAALLTIHWDIRGQPNGYAPKSFALLFAPVLGLMLTMVFAVIAILRPARSDDVDDGNGVALTISWIGALLVLTVGHAVVVLAARGVHLDVTGDMIFAVALLMTALGNFLGKTSANPYIGVRTSWTLQSDYSWEKSNRLCGRLFVAVGLITMGALAASDTTAATYLLIGGVLCAALICIPLSYYYWKHDPDRPAV